MKYLPLLLLTLLFNACDLFEDEHENNHIEVPAAIQDFITNNFAGFTIDEAETETLCDGTEVIEIEIENEEDDEMELVFDLENNLLYSEVEIEVADLPTAITTTLANDYPTFEIKEAARLDWADDTMQFEVEIKDGSTKLEVLFAADGTVICEEEDHH